MRTSLLTQPLPGAAQEAQRRRVGMTALEPSEQPHSTSSGPSPPVRHPRLTAATTRSRTSLLGRAALRQEQRQRLHFVAVVGETLLVRYRRSSIELLVAFFFQELMRKSR